MFEKDLEKHLKKIKKQLHEDEDRIHGKSQLSGPQRRSSSGGLGGRCKIGISIAVLHLSFCSQKTQSNSITFAAEGDSSAGIRRTVHPNVWPG